MTETAINELFNSFSQKKVLVIGDVMVDAYMWGNVNRISPEAPVPIVSSKKRENRLGGAANVARNIIALGATPILCSVIGNDEKGSIFKELLEKREMTQKGILSSEKRITTVKTRIISNSQQLLRVDEEIETPLDSETEEIFIELLLRIIADEKPDAIIFEDYDKGVITENLIEQVVEKANSSNIPTLVDPKKRNFLTYKKVSLFKPNFKELVEGLKIEIDKTNKNQLIRATQQFHEMSEHKIIMTTLSEAGVFISDNHQYISIPAEVRDITDVSGAGDTVISTAALCLASDLSLFEIASISNLAGGLVCEKVGVVPIDRELLIAEVKDYFNNVN